MDLMKGLLLCCIFLFACAGFPLLIFDLVYLNSRYLRARTVYSLMEICILVELISIILIVFVVFLFQGSGPRHIICLLNPAHRRVAHVSKLAVHHRVLVQRRANSDGTVYMSTTSCTFGCPDWSRLDWLSSGVSSLM